MGKMKAVIAYKPGDYRLEQVNIPVVGDTDLLIKVDAGGICASDRAIYKGGDPWGGFTDPFIPGHEFAGHIVEIGKCFPKKNEFKIGDRITADIVVPCRNCYYCNHGHFHICDNRQWIEGAWSEFMIIPGDAIIWRIPESFSPEEAALIESLSCSAHGVERGNIGFNDVVVVAGLGGIGIGMLQFAKLKNPRCIIGLDIDNGNRVFAKEMGADYTLDPSCEEVSSLLDELTEGRGCDIYFEASGNTKSLSTGLELLRKRGRLVVYSVYKDKARIDFNMVSEFKELDIVGGHLSPGTFPYTIRCIENNLIDAQAMATDVFSLEDYSEALNIKEAKLSIKTILLPR